MSGGWNISQVEHLVLLSMTCVDPLQKAQAVSQIHSLRSSPDRVQIGMQLFAEARDEMVRSFGLTLMREYLSLPSSQQSVETRQLLRHSVSEWLSSILGNSQTVPQHIKNQMLSIFTLCVKKDYPELWPTAFVDLLALAQRFGFAGVDTVIRVLGELEIEVVMFSEGRSREEIAHNTLIKDTMRATSVMQDIVRFLCQASVAAANAHGAQVGSVSTDAVDLGGRCLLALAELIGWIDVQLVLNDALPTILQFVPCSSLPACQVGAVHCVFELAKKGMDPVLKVSLLQKTDLVSHLLAMRTDFSRAEPLIDDQDHVLWKVHRQYGLALDMIALELLGCWSKYEDLLLPPPPSKAFVPASKFASGNVNGSMVSSPSVSSHKLSGPVNSANLMELASVAPLTVALLQQVAPEMLNFLRHPFVSVATTVLPSCTKLVQIFKSQKAKEKLIVEYMQAKSQADASFFNASVYLEPLLFSALQQCQIPLQFQFEELDADEEEENELLEGKREVRVLFANCVRVYPKEGLRVLVAALHSLPQPLSTAPFPPLEATLRLLGAFSDSGVSLQDHGLVDDLTQALTSMLQHTDVAQHAHTQVQLVFFEVCVRYVRLFCDRDVLSLCGALLHRLQAITERAHTSQRSLSSYHNAYRDKLAALALRLCEGLERRACILLDYSDVVQGLLAASGARLLESHRRGDGARACGALSANAEVSLASLLGLCVALLPAESDAVTAMHLAHIASKQNVLFTQCAQRVFTQMNEALTLSSHVDVTALVARQLNALSALVKNVPRNRRDEFRVVCEEISSFICSTLLPYALTNANSSSVAQSAASVVNSHTQSLRAKITVFLHHMLTLLGESSLGTLTQSILSLCVTAELSEIESALQLLQQLCAEFEDKSLPALATLWPAVLDKLRGLMLSVDRSAAASAECEAPHVESERVLCVRLLLNFLHTLALHRCAAVLYGSVDDMLLVLLRCVCGQSALGRAVSYSASLPLRRCSLVVVSALLGQWLYPTVSDGVSAVPVEIRDVFVRFLRDQYVPTIWQLLGRPRQGSASTSPSTMSVVRLNTQDAASQGVVAEIATLLFLLVRKHPQFNASQSTVCSQFIHDVDWAVYLSTLLREIGWSEQVVQQLLNELLYNPAVALGAFKDAMRQFARNMCV